MPVGLTTSLLGFSSQLCILLHPIQEILTAFGVSDVLNTDVHALLNVTVSDDLVHNDTNCSWGDVVDDAGAAIIESRDIRSTSRHAET